MTTENETIAGYTACALHYAEVTKPADADGSPALQQLRAALPVGAGILEIGSGPGWDADWLETHGFAVERTDATPAFIALQRDRGRQATRLDVVHDDLGGPHDAIVALYVLQHVERSRLADVFGRMARAVVDGGHLLFSLMEGDSDFVDVGKDGSRYHITRWRQAEIEPLLHALGFTLLWSQMHDDTEGRWFTMLMQRGSVRD